MTKQITTPKSRKPSTKAGSVPATASVAAQLAAAVPQIAAKQAEKAPKASKTPDLKLVVKLDPSVRGHDFVPTSRKVLRDLLGCASTEVH